MSDLVSQRPANSAGVLDRNNAGGGILVGDQVPDLSYSTAQARAQSVIGVGSHPDLHRLAQHDHVSELGFVRPTEIRDRDRSPQRTDLSSEWSISERIGCPKVSARFLRSICVLSVIVDHLDGLNPWPMPCEVRRTHCTGEPLGSPTSR
ncbi:hypothetical protein [Streptomyces sp. NBC_00316]|uniref:hypothetical protein n=1 Tax=Streptomyces sp. NBC_00316 TaxID=2975710 RepID=UPI002E2802E9|nr:hypothetical protein [Streptomyces sp. NBC_00316]